MTKWFDTNYHYLVPELAPRPGRSGCAPTHWIEPLREAAALGIETRPVVLGPVSFLLLSKGVDRPLDLLEALLPVYEELLRRADRARARREVQLDEPCLALDRTAARARRRRRRVDRAGGRGRRALPGDVLRALGRRARARARAARRRGPPRPRARAGAARAALRRAAPRRGCRSACVDGRNVWATDLDRALDRDRRRGRRARRRPRHDRAVVLAAARARTRRRARPGSTPRSARGSRSRPRSWPSWARCAPRWTATATRCSSPRASVAARRASARTNDPAVRARGAAPARLRARRAVRAAPRGAARADAAAGAADDDDRLVPADRRDPRRAPRPARGPLDGRLRALPGGPDRRGDRASRSTLGLDVLVHGEPERNDMVEYFGEQLAGSRSPSTAGCSRYGSALREAADPLRRRLAPGADDRALVAVRAVADREAGQGDADRAGHDPAVVVRARRPAAPRDLHADRARDPRRGARPRARRLRSRSRSTRRRCARACRCGARTRTTTCAGRSTASA